jgi:predicted AAA+ superfamily ATPase
MDKLKLIDRPDYIRQLKEWSAHSDLIKIVTGVRRCGKSFLLKLFSRYLIETGVSPSQIHEIAFDLDENGKYLDRERLSRHIMKSLVPDKMNYVFLDEIQLVKDWQKTANTLKSKNNIDLYLTGSNAYMFSGELTTLLGGRYIEIKMHPLSFNEYVSGRRMLGRDDSLPELYDSYINEGGFPKTLYLENKNLIRDYVMNVVYQNTIMKDIITRFKIADKTRLDDVVRYIFDNISNLTSLRGISNGIAVTGRKISVETIDSYIQGLSDSYMFYKCKPFDIKGKRILNADSKYYVCDTGLRAMLLGKENADLGKILENVVFLELIRRGYQVNVGRIGRKLLNNEMQSLETDFVAQKPGGIIEYYQVAVTTLAEETFNREIRSLTAIKDNYPKYLLTLDAGTTEYKGIKRLNVLKWLLESKYSTP